MNIEAGAASRVQTLREGRKTHLRQTEHPNAMLASECCSGQRKDVVQEIFHSARPVRLSVDGWDRPNDVTGFLAGEGRVEN